MPGMNVEMEIVERVEDFLATIGAARAADVSAHGPCRYFSHPAWTDLCWTRREAPRGSRFLGLVARREGRVLGWWSLVISKRSLDLRLQNIGQEISDYAEPHVAATLSPEDRDALTLAFLAAVAGEAKRFTFAQFANLHPAHRDGFLAEVRRLPGHWRASGPRDDLFLDASPFGGDFEAYVQARFSRKSRKNMRNEWNVLCRRGEPVIERIGDIAAFEALKDDYFAWYRYGDDGAARRDKLDLWWAFYRAVFDDLLEASVLRIDGRPVSLILAFRRGADRDLFSMTFDPALAEESVGKLHLQRVVRAWMEEGGHTFHFLVGTEDYKRHLATGKVETRTLFLHHRSGLLAALRSLSPKGEAIG